ncbi:MAG: hypothetical protein GKR89_37480 [Candidatus Latescibacteria bacterium]|nr:hypothetical protein [Candidatus Latescibacterota bacterium]
MQGPLLPAGEAYSLAQRLTRIFFAPRSSFEAVYRHETWLDWFAPTLLASTAWILAHFITLPLATDPTSALARRQMQNMTAEQWQVRTDMLQQYGWLSEPLVYTFFNLSVTGIVLFVLVRHLFRRQITLRQGLVVTAYAFMVDLVAAPIWTALVLLDIHPEQFTSLALFLGDGAGTFTDKFSASLGLFGAWQTCLIGLGLAVATNIDPRKTIAAALIVWVLWIAGVTAVQDLVPTQVQQAPPTPN